MRNLFNLILLVVVLLGSCKRGILNEVNGKKTEVQAVTQVNWVGHWKNEGERGNLVREVATEYEFLHQNIKVNLKFPEDLYNADDTKEVEFIITQMQKSVADWDIVRIKEHYSTIAKILKDDNWGQKYLVDFGQVEGFKEKHLDFINDKAFSQNTGNILLCPYNEGQFWALYVNLNVAKKMGIEVKQYGMTFDDFMGYIKVAYNYNKSHSDYIAPIFEDRGWITSEAIWKSLVYSLLGTYSQLNDKLDAQKLDAIEKTFLAYEQLSKYEPIIRNRASINWERDNGYPLQDSCLFFVNGSWMYNIWKKKNFQKMKNVLPCELPVFRSPDFCMGGYAPNWAVLKNGANREQAIKLMMFWTRPEIAEKWARYTKCPSGIKGNLTNTSFGVDEYENFMYSIEKKYGGKKVSQVSNTFILGEKSKFVKLNTIDVLEGKMTAKQAMRELKPQLKY